MNIVIKECLSNEVESLMHRLCRDSGDLLGNMVWEHISSGGKRLRSRLALSSVGVLGGLPENAVGWGAACELLHNASLIHDDIQDGDRYRRSKPTLWHSYGIAQAINAGDLCIALAYAALEELSGTDSLRWRLTQLVTQTSRALVRGQAEELSLLSRKALTWEAYSSAVRGKTSALFSLPIEGAALLAGKRSEEAALLAKASSSLGLLFQMQDDLLDLYGTNGRDRPASDLAQPGKVTALVIEHLRLHPRDESWLLAILQESREKTSVEVVEKVIEAFKVGGAVSAVWKRMDEIHHNLLDSLKNSNEPHFTSYLQGFINDILKPILHTRPQSEVA